MLEGYRPIDFGNFFNSVPEDQIRNRVGLSQAAMNILANSQASSVPIIELMKQGYTPSGSGNSLKFEAPKRKQTLWGRIGDFLSSPMYAVANAADEALAGHQESDTDSVLSDIGKTIGGVFTGAGRGFGAGMVGAFGPSETAAEYDPDKKYLGDVMVRFDTHMAAEDAMKPENREKVRQALMNKKINQFSDDPKEKYFYKWDKGRVEVTDDDIDDYFKDMQLYGFAASAIADPLNFVSVPIKGAQATAEVPEIISGSKNTYEGFKVPVEGAVNTGSDFKLPTVGKAPGEYRIDITPAAIQNRVATTSGIITTPEWFNFPRNASEVNTTTRSVTSPVEVNKLDPLDSILGDWASGAAIQSIRQNKNLIPAKIPDEQLKLADSLVKNKNLSTDILGSLIRGNTPATLQRLFPGGNAERLTNLNRFVDHMRGLPDISKRLAIPAERKKIQDALQRVLKADSEALKVPNVTPAKNLIADAEKIGATPTLVEGARPQPIKSKNPKRDEKIAMDTYFKFGPQISGNAIPTGIKNPAAYGKAIASGKTIRYSGSQQVQMWNHITHTLKDVKSPNRFAVANNILRQVEDKFLAKGLKPMSGYRTATSFPLRLSQVLDAIGPAAAAMNPTLLTKILRGEPEALKQLPVDVVQRIEEFKAGESLVEAPAVVKGVDTASKNIEDLIKGPLSAARQEEIVTIGSRAADDIARMAGGSPTAGITASKIVKNEFSPKSPVNSAVNASTLNTTALISHPNISPRLLARYSSAPAVDRAINKIIGGPAPRNLGGKLVPEWLGARFNAAYKNADMRPVYLRNATVAKSTVARRAEALNRLAKTYNVNDVDLWNDALKASQGKLDPVPGSPAADLSQEILQIMENLFGSSSIARSHALANSVVGRSQLFMNELNSNLRRFGLGKYKFKQSKGTDWLNSWQTWDIDRPLDFLFKVQNVVEHTVREKIMFDDIAARWGSRVKDGDFTQKVKHPRLEHLYFGSDAASQANQFIKNLKEISTPNSKQMQMFDKALSKWKAGVTIYVPSHHIRNMIGDLYFNWLGGVNSARAYGTAMKIMKSQKGRYEGLDEISALSNPETLKRLATGRVPTTPSGRQVALTMRNGQHVTNDEVYISAFQHGILPSTRVLEDIPDDVATAFERFKPLGGKGQKAAHTLSEGRDHYVRLAHYVDALKKSPKSFEAAADDAAAIVRKWHPDGMDLTKFERNVMRRMFPFYSWTRKALPLIVESLVATPGKVTAYPKLSYELQIMMGTAGPTMADPFPVDQLFPDWIREKGIGPAFGPESAVTGILGGNPGYSVVNPSNPTMDMIAQIDNPGKTAMGMLNPAARIPIELSTGRDTQSGAPIQSITDTDYLIKQIPGLSHAGRVTGEFGTSDTVKETSQGYNMQNIINLLTALGAQNTGPYQKSAEFDLREFLKNGR